MKPTLEEYLLKEAQGHGFDVAKGSVRIMSPRMRGVNKDIWAYWLPQWAINAAANYHRIKSGTGIKLLSDSAKNIPAVVVGVGPSLDEQIEWIGKAERNAIIIATDASLRALAAAGVTPHLVVQLDCRPENASMFESFDTSPYIMLTNSCANPKQLDAWRGRFLFYNMMMQGAEFTDQILPLMFPGFGAVESKATVGNTAVLIASFMGCTPIIACGMDLCYQNRTEGGHRYRAKDYKFMPEEPESGLPARWEQFKNTIIYDDDERFARAFQTKVKGQDFWVDGELDFYRNVLVDMVGPTGIHLVNCATDGALKDLVETMEIRKALEKYCMPAFEEGSTIVPHLNKIVPMLEGSHAR